MKIKSIPYHFALFAFSISIVSASHAQSTLPNHGNNVDPLPVKSVTLFSSGVSYTLREGEVIGDATIPLAFRTAQINDILKSLVLLDEQGTVQPAVYGAKDPIGRALQSFAVDLTQPTDRVSLLNRLKGTKVQVTTPRSSLTGQLVGLDPQTAQVDSNHTIITRYDLSLMSEMGLQTVNLSDITTIRFLDAKLDKEFREALTLMASGSDDKRRQVTLRFSGQGKRRVRVGYIAEAPLWKISYRLLIGGEKSADNDKPYLQGWAMVENTTDDDWSNVSLSLVSGRPVSFIQDLYQPLYLPRPVVPPDVIASPTPQIAESSVDSPVVSAPAAIALNGEIAERKIVADSLSRSVAKADMSGGGFGGAGGGFGGGGSFNSAMRGSMVAQASGQKAGELFQYNIKTPVSLPRQQAAMIPVIAQDVDGEKVSLYNADSDARFPLNAFRIKNNTKLHLKAGPITIFDNGLYAGDARMEDIPPSDSRLVTYAVDLAVEGERQSTGNQTETALLIRRGVLEQTLKERSETTYTLKNKDEKPRTILVEHAFNPEFKLVAPEKYEERTPNWYRFLVKIPAGGTEKLSVIQEHPLFSRVSLLDSDISMINFWYERRETPATVKTALAEILTRRRKLEEMRKRQQSIVEEIKQIGEDQDRIRKNMQSLDKVSALYQRYVKQLDEQETKIQALQTETTRLRTESLSAEQALRQYLDNLNIG